MANILDGLLGRIPNEDLRRDLAAEIAKVKSGRDYGLVFERHLPEAVRLSSHPVRPGVRVRERQDSTDETWLVDRVKDGIADLIDTAGQLAERDVVDLVVVREFGETIYPGLTRVGSVSRGGGKPPHLVVNGENYHVLETLQYAYEGQVDAIYIDPPYNTGAKDWKYSNDYVEETDAYKHSKWLAFMERRLLLARRLLNPTRSVLIVTIDEKEYLRLGLLLEQIFPDCRVQMISITISPRGTSRSSEFSRVDEYAFFVFVGDAAVEVGSSSGTEAEVRWQYLRRTQKTLVRGSRPNQFYAIYVDEKSKKVVHVGEPMGNDDPLNAVPAVPGAIPVFPIDPEGLQLIWGLTPATLRDVVAKGYIRVTDGNEHQAYTIAYLSTTNIKKAEVGEELRIVGTRDDGSKIVVIPGGKAERLSTVWRESRHDAGAYGTSLLRSLIPGRSFPFPKSLYAVEDTLRAVVGTNSEALVVDFFGGSGTTAHAVARLNRQDGGRRRSIVVTNNEVSAAEAAKLREAGHAPGDPQWEALGIFEYITRPRIAAAITGETPDGNPIDDNYRFGEEFPMSEGLDENVEFLELTYLDPDDVTRGAAFAAIAPLLWMRAGAVGPIIERPAKTFAAPVDASYAVLFDVAHWASFVDAVRDRTGLRHLFIVTDSLAQYRQVVAELPPTVETSMLYKDYLRNFEHILGTS